MTMQTAIKDDLNQIKQKEKARVLPRQYDEKLHARFILWRDQSGKSLARIAAMLGRSVATISTYINNRYEGNIQTLEEDIHQLLRRAEDYEFTDKAEIFCVTEPSILIWEVLEYCDRKRKMGIAVAQSGTGKSETCKEYKQRNRLSIYITIKITTRTIGSLLRKIAARTGGVSTRATLDLYLETIIDRIKDSHRLLMLDDAHYLNWDQIETLKAIHDCARVGIVLLGQEKLYNQMMGNTHKAELFDQTHSRIAIKRDRFSIEKKDVRTIVDSIWKGLDNQCIDYLFKKARGKGRFRSMKELLDLAVEMHKYDNKRIDVDLLKEAEQFLIKS